VTEKPPLPTAGTRLLEYPYVVVRFRCHVCERGGDARTVACAVSHGSRATIGKLLRIFMKQCPWSPYDPSRRPRKYGHRCGAYMPDLIAGRPPDLPPAMTGLTLIEGGKNDMLPAAPSSEPARRRVGAEDE
jgi:hypothetical protein